MSDGDWFAPKRFGYGAGLPIAWQGWALIIGRLSGHGRRSGRNADAAPSLCCVTILVAATLVLTSSAHSTRAAGGNGAGAEKNAVSAPLRTARREKR